MRRPRGRPQHLPVDPSSSTDSQLDGTKRLAWLLATRRLIGPDGAVSRTEFVQRLRLDGVKADSSRISRWESGLEPVPVRLVMAYETATGAPPYSIVAIRQHLIRHGHIEEGGDVWAQAEESETDRLGRIIERIQSHTMHGHLWLQFAEELSRFDHVYMHQRAWRAATDLLVDELARSTGVAHLRRHEAAVHLLSDKKVRPHLTRSVGQFTLEPGAQAVTPVLSMMGEVPDKAIHDLLLRMIRTAQPGLAGSAALIASQMIGRGFVSPEEPALQGHLVAAVRARHQIRMPMSAADLACRLAKAPFERVLQALTDLEERARLHRMRETREVVEPGEARQISDRIASRAEAAVGRSAHEPDQMLRILTREALFHVHHDRRRLASTLLSASPYAAALASAAIDTTRSPDLETAARGWAMTRRMAMAAPADALAETVLAEDRPGLRSLAMTALAASRDAMTDTVARHVVAVVTDPATRRQTSLAGILALGMHRQSHRIDPDVRPELAHALAWWRTSGGAIHEA